MQNVKDGIKIRVRLQQKINTVETVPINVHVSSEPEINFGDRIFYNSINYF